MENIADVIARRKSSVEDGTLKTIKSELPEIIRDVFGEYGIGNAEVRFEDSNGLDIQNNDLKFIISMDYSFSRKTARKKLIKQIAEKIRKIIPEDISISVCMRIFFSVREEL